MLKDPFFKRRKRRLFFVPSWTTSLSQYAFWRKTYTLSFDHPRHTVCSFASTFAIYCVTEQLAVFVIFFVSFFRLPCFLGMGFTVQTQRHTLLQIFATLFEHFERARECQQACSESLPKFIGVRSRAGVERPSCCKTYILDVHFNDVHKMLTKTHVSLAVCIPRKH